MSSNNNNSQTVEEQQQQQQPQPQHGDSDAKFPSRTIDGVLYRLDRPDDADAVVSLALSDFCGRMPLYREAGATTAADVEVSLNFLPSLVGLGESIVAVDPDTRELLGVRLSGLERRCQPDSVMMKHPLMLDASLAARYPKESVVMRCVDKLLTEANYFSHYPDVDLALAARILAVRESHCGKGIGLRLMECAIELAQGLGAQLIVGATQSHFSQRIYQRLGFTRLHEFSIPDYVDPLTRQRPFAGLASSPHQEAIFFARRLP